MASVKDSHEFQVIVSLGVAHGSAVNLNEGLNESKYVREEQVSYH